MEALFTDILLVILFLTIIVLIVYVLIFKGKPEEKLRYDKMRKGVIFLPNECGDVVWKQKEQERRVQINKATRYNNKALQKLVKNKVEKTPIDTAVRITNYANDILDDLEFCRLLPQGWEPVLALHYINSVCMVRYKKRPPKDAPKNAPKSTDYKDVYFSTEDGHIIHFKPSS